MISSLGWIRRSAASTTPTRYTLTPADYQNFSDQIAQAKAEASERGLDLDNYDDDEDSEEQDSDYDMDESEQEATTDNTAAADVPTPPMSPVNDEDIDSKYNMDDYDTTPTEPIQVDAVFTPLHALVHPDDDTTARADFNRDSDEEDDLTLRPTDRLFVAAKTEDDVPQLEVYVFEEDPVDGDNLYVHHDLMLSSFPLCLEWLSHPINGGTNHIAVGTLEPEIEIWNLDMIDVVYPSLCLANGHKDAVMSLAWNKGATGFLASGSADCSVQLWDLNSSATSVSGSTTTINGSLRSFSLHGDKVQALQWNETSTSVLASAAYDKYVRVFDVRSPDSCLRFPKLHADPEQLRWASEHVLAVSDESGRVSFFDTRKPEETLSVLDAHPKSTTLLDFCPLLGANGERILLTGSPDKSLKVWGLDSSFQSLSLLTSRDVSAVGKVFAGGFLPEAPLVIAAGGSRGSLEMWNLRGEEVIKQFLLK